MILDGDIGIVALEYQSMKCVVCESNYCRHSVYVKSKVDVGCDSVQEIEEGDNVDEKLISSNSLTINLKQDEKIALNKTPFEIFRYTQIDGEDMFVVKEDFGDETCVVCQASFDFKDCVGEHYTKKNLLYRTHIYPCAGEFLAFISLFILILNNLFTY